MCDVKSVPFVDYKCEKGSLIEALNADQIKNNMFLHGPMQTGFNVYEDFYNYKSGVYHYVSGKFLGGHAVKILGWGN